MYFPTLVATSCVRLPMTFLLYNIFIMPGRSPLANVSISFSSCEYFYIFTRGTLSDLHTSKRFDLIDMFNETSRYLDDIFTIDNPELEKHIPDIYIQLNLVVTFIPAFTTNAMTSDFLSLIFHG